MLYLKVFFYAWLKFLSCLSLVCDPCLAFPDILSQACSEGEALQSSRFFSQSDNHHLRTTLRIILVSF